MDESVCSSWAGSDPLLKRYHDREWCRISHDDRYQFEMLCLEGASTGLSWRTILHKREAYREAFHQFDIEKCAEMTEDELTGLLDNPGLIRNRGKIFSVRENARVVRRICRESGSFDRYLWHFTGGKQIVGGWKSLSEVPAVSPLSREVSGDMKKRGMKYVGPVITYSFLQAVGILNDHLTDCYAFDV